MKSTTNGDAASIDRAQERTGSRARRAAGGSLGDMLPSMSKRARTLVNLRAFDTGRVGIQLVGMIALSLLPTASCSSAQRSARVAPPSRISAADVSDVVRAVSANAAFVLHTGSETFPIRVTSITPVANRDEAFSAYTMTNPDGSQAFVSDAVASLRAEGAPVAWVCFEGGDVAITRDGVVRDELLGEAFISFDNRELHTLGTHPTMKGSELHLFALVSASDLSADRARLPTCWVMEGPVGGH